MLRTPVAFLIFNRPEVTRRVFAEIAKVRPARLFVIADGPRANRPGEAAQCAATQRVIEQIDWPCEVETNFAPQNLGCKRRVSSGIDWVFSRTNEAIFLEDDCVPDVTFFRFCEEMLDRYRDDTRVMHIGGANFQRNAIRPTASYYFSRHVHVWGWASWRRAWRHYDVGISQWPELRDAGRVSDAFPDPNERRAATRLLDNVFAGITDTWDAQWTLACRLQHGLTILPAHNLVCNIGFGREATHTSDPGHPVANLRAIPLNFPLVHPTDMLPDSKADSRTVEAFRSSTYRRARSFIFRLWHRKTEKRSESTRRAGASESSSQARAGSPSTVEPATIANRGGSGH